MPWPTDRMRPVVNLQQSLFAFRQRQTVIGRTKSRASELKSRPANNFTLSFCYQMRGRG